MKMQNPTKCRVFAFRIVATVYGAVKKLGGGPSPSGRGRRDSLIEAGAPGEGRAEREPDRAKPQEKSSQILRPSPSLKASPSRARASRPLPEGEGESSAITIFHNPYDRPHSLQPVSTVVREAQARERAASIREAQARERAASIREAQARERAASINDRRYSDDATVFGDITVPDFHGKSLRQVTEECLKAGLRLQSAGSGAAVEQIPPSGVIVPVGTRVEVRFSTHPSQR